jgi:hypothetical protein
LVVRSGGMDVVRTSLSEIRESSTPDSALSKGTFHRAVAAHQHLESAVLHQRSCPHCLPMDGVEDMPIPPPNRPRRKSGDRGEMQS